MAATRGIPLGGDRGAFDTVDHPAKHALDIKNNALLRHLPAIAAAGNYARDNGTNWVVQSGIPLTDLNSYAQGSIIRGGAADWEAYAAKTLGAVLIGDGTNVLSRVLEEDDLPDRSATQIGQVWFSVDGATMSAQLPVTDPDGGAAWIIEENSGVLVVVDGP